MGNWYEVLGTTAKADDEQIKAAFRNLAKTFHPDLNAGDQNAEERFKEVKQAYEVLRDPEARATYDTYLATKRSRARQRLRKTVATMSAAFVLSGASSFLFINWLERESSVPAQDHAPTRLSEKVPVMPTPGFLTEADAAPSRQDGGEGTATASSIESGRVAQTEATQAVQVDAQNSDRRMVRARWLAYQRRRMAHVLNVAPSTAEARLEAEESTSPRAPTWEELEQAVRMLNKGQQFLAQGNIVIAREYFARAAELGSPVAALKLAETYDPQELGHFVYGMKRDPSEARKWYKRAIELGLSEAEGKLRRLDSQ
jgi:curved DNA-binding protein CbpA